MCESFPSVRGKIGETVNFSKAIGNSVRVFFPKAGREKIARSFIKIPPSEDLFTTDHSKPPNSVTQIAGIVFTDKKDLIGAIPFFSCLFGMPTSPAITKTPISLTFATIVDQDIASDFEIFSENLLT